MKKYTDKELQAMSPEELDAVREQAMREFADAGDELTAFLRREELLKQIPVIVKVFCKDSSAYLLRLAFCGCADFCGWCTHSCLRSL